MVHSGVQDKTFIQDMLTKGQEIENKAIALEKEILTIANGKIKL